MVFGRLRELFRRISIRYSIFIYFTVTALAASVLIGVSLYIRMSDQISDTLEEENQILVNQLNRSVDSWLRNIMKLSDSLYYGVIKNADLSEESIAGEMTLLYDNGKDYVENLALFSREGELLEAVVSEGGARNAAIEGYRIGGKTGTAQVYKDGRIVRDEFGRVTAIVEEKDATVQEKAIREVNTGIMVLPTDRLERWLSNLSNENAQGEYYLTDVIGLAAAENATISTVHPRHVYEVEGVNSKVQLARLERMWQRAQAHQLLEDGVTLLDPERIDIRGRLTCGRDVEIDVGCVFEGDVVLEDKVRVGAYCVLKDTVVRRGTEILPFTHSDGAEVGEDSRIGPYSRLRPGAKLAGENHIGNFVEIKKSSVGSQSKINHLSYVGDAEVGARVNIGAGTITCNYDGVNKFKTVIGDDAFIGSDTQLVAPVTVGAGATLGAGTTLTRNAPEGKLTLSRAKQMTVEHWVRPTKKH